MHLAHLENKSEDVPQFLSHAFPFFLFHSIRRMPEPRQGRRETLLCPGCGKAFANISLLRRHRNSRWLTESACHTSTKRPRIVPVRAAADGNANSDFNDHLARMMGDADNCDFPPGAAPQPLLLPLHDSDMVSEAVPVRAQQR